MKADEYIFKKIPIPPTAQSIYFIMCKSKDLHNIIKQEMDIDITNWEPPNAYDGIAFQIDLKEGKKHVLVINSDYKYRSDILVHESVHSAYDILAYVGDKHSADNHEWFAYTTQYIYAQATKAMKDKDNLKTIN